MSTNVLVSVSHNGIATLTLNRPLVHNAFDDVMIEEFLALLQKIHHDPSIRVVILAANGPSFSAGADLNWMRRMAAYSYEENLQDALVLAELMQSLKSLKQPTIARVQGAAFGGGVGLVACCDMAIISSQASFCLSEVKIGLMPAVISPYVIAALGERAARYYFLTAERMSAEDALHYGLATRLVEHEQLDDAVEAICLTLLANSPQALKATKVLINRVSPDPYNSEHHQHNAEAIAAIRVSSEGQEGLNNFLEKRPSHWGK